MKSKSIVKFVYISVNTSNIEEINPSFCVKIRNWFWVAVKAVKKGFWNSLWNEIYATWLVSDKAH